MRMSGLSVGEMIQKLEILQQQYGSDVEVWIDGSDYPEGVSSVVYIEAKESYWPRKCIRIVG